MASLTVPQKRFLVAELAMYGRPTAIAKAFEAQFGKKVSRQQVESYDAGKARVREYLGEDLIDLFDRVRAQWDEEVVNLSIFNKRWRGEELQSMYDALPANATKRKQALLEQAAKEAGDAYTNRLKIDHKIESLTDADLLAELAALAQRSGVGSGGAASGSDRNETDPGAQE